MATYLSLNLFVVVLSSLCVLTLSQSITYSNPDQVIGGCPACNNVVVDGSNNVYASCNDINAVIKYDGTSQSTLSGSCAGLGSLAVDSANNVYATCANFALKWSAGGTGTGQAVCNSFPCTGVTSGVVLDSQSNIYLACQPQNVITVCPSGGTGTAYNLTGSPCSEANGMGFLYISPNNNLYVICYGDGTFYKYANITGSPVQMVNPAVLAMSIWPTGIAVDTSNNLYASAGNSVYVFPNEQPTNSPIVLSGCVGARGSTVDKNGDLVVACNGDQYAKYFRLGSGNAIQLPGESIYSLEQTVTDSMNNVYAAAYYLDAVYRWTATSITTTPGPTTTQPATTSTTTIPTSTSTVTTTGTPTTSPPATTTSTASTVPPSSLSISLALTQSSIIVYPGTIFSTSAVLQAHQSHSSTALVPGPSINFCWSALDLPEGVSALFSQGCGVVAGSDAVTAESDLTLNVAASITPGIYPIEVSATASNPQSGASASALVQFLLTVADPNLNLTVSVAPQSVTIRAGEVLNLLVSVQQSPGLVSEVSYVWQARGLPEGVSGIFTPAIATTNGYGTEFTNLQLDIDADAHLGNYALTILVIPLTATPIVLANAAQLQVQITL